MELFSTWIEILIFFFPIIKKKFLGIFSLIEEILLDIIYYLIHQWLKFDDGNFDERLMSLSSLKFDKYELHVIIWAEKYTTSQNYSYKSCLMG